MTGRAYRSGIAGPRHGRSKEFPLGLLIHRWIKQWGSTVTEPDVVCRSVGVPAHHSLFFPSSFLKFPSHASRLPARSSVSGLFALLDQAKISIIRNDVMYPNVPE